MSFRPELNWLIVSDLSPAARGGRARGPQLDVHDFHEIVYVSRGAGIMQIAQTRHPAKAGDVFLINPGERHANTGGDSGACSVCFLAFSCARGWQAKLERRLGRRRFPNRPAVPAPATARLFAELHAELQADRPLKDSVAALHIERYLLDVLRAALEPAADRPAAEREATDHTLLPKVVNILEMSRDRRVCVEELARQCYLSRAYFSKVFKRETGESPARFVLKQKMALAFEMLREPGAKVVAVAVALGFEDEFYFSKVFKRLIGMTPSAYRKEGLPRTVAAKRPLVQD
ncbi:MAG: AraC family transcriptional regulator [Kiritimatiellae bacterium]|nr:AraC family transcriptional regulator [Kiritimatiellia bacterium]